MINSKSKGSSYERKIANLLSDRFKTITGLEKSFQRNPDSGSFMGGKNVSRLTTHSLDKMNFGDIITPLNFKFSIETKHYKEPITFSMLVKQQCKFLDDWIKQAEQDAKSSGKKVMIIAKFNGIPEIVLHKENIAGTMTYKTYNITTLEEFLKQPDKEFWE